METRIYHLGLGKLLHVGNHIIQFQSKFTLLFLQLLLHSLEVVDLLSQISYTVGMFLPECRSSGLMLQSGLFKVSAQFL